MSPNTTTKKALIVNAVARIIKDYAGIKLTLRSLHYRVLEHAKSDPALEYDNTVSAYKRLSAILVEARRDGVIPADVFEDKGRDVKNYADDFYYHTRWLWSGNETDPVEVMRRHVGSIVRRAQAYQVGANAYQPRMVLVFLEKAALENLFIPICQETGTILVVSRGYNSYTQLDELATILRKETREIHVISFSDFDPSGLDIERNFLDQIQGMGIHLAGHDRIALTVDQITAMSLPFAPTKLKDSRANGWTAAGVVELDAVEPRVLQTMLRDAIHVHHDEAISHEVERLQRACRRLAIKKIKKIVAGIDAAMGTAFVAEFSL